MALCTIDRAPNCIIFWLHFEFQWFFGIHYLGDCVLLSFSQWCSTHLYHHQNLKRKNLTCFLNCLLCTWIAKVWFGDSGASPMKILKQRSKLNRHFRVKIDTLFIWACTEGTKVRISHIPSKVPSYELEGTKVRRYYEGTFEGTKVLNLRRFYLRPN